jgi:nitrite reductase/ring-hydroxylating ferredoxin subunit
MPDHIFSEAYPGSRVEHVGTYARVLPVSLERMFENALDWEHLPWLHRSSFASISCEDAGPWGWRASVTNTRGETSLLELRLDTRQRRWVTRTLQGKGAGAEIWTYVIERGPAQIEVVIDFFVPDVPEASRAKVGAAYARVYETLYDEDVSMMQGRQRLLNERVPPLQHADPPQCLGDRAEIAFPVGISFAGRSVLVWAAGDSLYVTAARCPHYGADLCEGTRDADSAICPWHGYRFDLQSGECSGVSTLSIATGYSAWEEAGKVWIGWARP